MCLPFVPCDNNYYKMVSQLWEVVRDFYFLPIWESTKSFVSADKTLSTWGEPERAPPSRLNGCAVYTSMKNIFQKCAGI